MGDWVRSLTMLWIKTLVSTMKINLRHFSQNSTIIIIIWKWKNDFKFHFLIFLTIAAKVQATIDKYLYLFTRRLFFAIEQFSRKVNYQNKCKVSLTQKLENLSKSVSMTFRRMKPLCLKVADIAIPFGIHIIQREGKKTSTDSKVNFHLI